VAGWTELAGGIESIVKTIAILTGGGWVFLRYVYQGEFKRRVEFNVDVNFVSIHQDVWLVELIASVENKGLVTHQIADFSFKLRCLFPEDAVEVTGRKANFQTNFPHKLKTGTWLPNQWGNSFVRPGVCTRYVFVTDVPKRAVAVVLSGRFRYPERESFHTAVKLVKVPGASSTEGASVGI
jgi:hypothetical protein